MAASESLRFDIIGNDRASDAFSKVGRSAEAMSGKMGDAAAKSAFLDDALKRQAETSRRSSDATLALAKSDGILAEVEKRLADGALEAEFALKKETEALKDAKREADRLDGKKVRVKVEVTRSGWSRIGGLFGGGGGAGGEAGGSGGGFSSLLTAGTPLVNPYTITAGLASAPIIAQGAAGAGILGLGGALAGIGIMGALGSNGQASPLQMAAAQKSLEAAQLREIAAQQNLNKLQASGKATAGQLASAQASLASATGSAASAQDKLNKLQDNQGTAAQAHLRASLKALSQDWQDSLAKIGASFVPVLQSIFTTADGVLKKMTPVFAGAEKTIAGPFKTFSNTLLTAFTQPAVKTSINAVAQSFGLLLKALTPQLGADMAQVADGITRIARSVADHPQAFADIVQGFFKIAGIALDTISALANFEGYLQQHFWPAMHRTSVIFDGVRHEVVHIVDDMMSALIRTYNALWNTIIGSTIRFGHNVETQWNSVTHEIAVVFDGMRGQVGRIYNNFWNDTIGATIRFGHNIETQFNSIIGSITGFFKRLPGEILGAVGNAGNVLQNWGAGVIKGLLSGMSSVVGSVWNFIKSIPGKILGFLGIHSPPQWAIDAGRHIMNGLGIGMGQAQAKAKAATASFQQSIANQVAGNLGGGAVAPASGSALAAQRYASSLLSMYGWPQSQMGSLIPLWNQESGWNAYAVNPSSGAYGIPQALGKGHPYNLGDYANQVVWGLNYIRGRYGTPAAAEAHELRFGWYDRGGYLPPGLSLAYNGTGQPEPVGPVRGGGNTYNITVHVPPTVNPASAGQQIANLLGAHIKRGGRIYPAGVTPR